MAERQRVDRLIMYANGGALDKLAPTDTLLSAYGGKITAALDVEN